MGYRVMIVPSDLQRAAIRAMQEAAAAIRETGTAAGLGDRLAGFDERDAIARLEEWQQREDRFARAGDRPEAEAGTPQEETQ
jgi:2-methylisocitrate lyase-like PEP mutase family enzyme